MRWLIAIAFTGFATFVASQALAAALTRGPYLQSNSSQAAIVVWELDSSASAVVEYGLDLAYGAAKPSSSADKHAVVIAGLLPGMRYYYRIVVGGQVLAAGLDYWFETSPLDGDVDFLVFGDSGNGSVEQFELAAFLVSEPVDLLLHTGDLVYDSGQQSSYNGRFFVPYADILRHTPVFPTLGNHDIFTFNGQPYLDNFHLPSGYLGGERVYSFNWGAAHFVSIESNNLTMDIANWVNADLAATAKPWKFVYLHHPAYSCDGRPSANVLALLVPLFEAQDVDVVFSGHDHNYQRSFPVLNGLAFDQSSDPDYVDPPGVVYVVTGGGGEFDPVSDSCSYTSAADSVVHYTRASVSGNQLTLEAVDRFGLVFDHSTITRTDLTTDAVESSPFSGSIVVRPNPSSGVMLLDFRPRLPGAPTTARIYSPAGHLVRTLLVNDSHVTWNGRDDHGRRAAAGVYFVSVGRSTKASASGAKIVLRR